MSCILLFSMTCFSRINAILSHLVPEMLKKMFSLTQLYKKHTRDTLSFSILRILLSKINWINCFFISNYVESILEEIRFGFKKIKSIYMSLETNRNILPFWLSQVFWVLGVLKYFIRCTFTIKAGLFSNLKVLIPYVQYASRNFLYVWLF